MEVTVVAGEEDEEKEELSTGNVLVEVEDEEGDDE